MENVVTVLGYSTNTGIYKIETDGQKSTAPSEYVLERGTGEKYMRFSFIARQLRWLRGEILTVAEATIDDPRKLAATKQLIKDKFDAKISWIYELAGMPEDEQDSL